MSRTPLVLSLCEHFTSMLFCGSKERAWDPHWKSATSMRRVQASAVVLLSHLHQLQKYDFLKPKYIEESQHNESKVLRGNMELLGKRKQTFSILQIEGEKSPRNRWISTAISVVNSEFAAGMTGVDLWELVWNNLTLRVKSQVPMILVQVGFQMPSARLGLFFWNWNRGYVSIMS